MFQSAINAGANFGETAEAIKEWKEKGTDSKYFRRWFGDSKVVDEDGNPLVVYHGSNENFDTFNIDNFGINDSGWLGMGFYFSDKKETASNYTDTNNIKEVYLSLNNPFVINSSEYSYSYFQNLRKELGIKSNYGNNSEEFTNYLKEKGYDSVILNYKMVMYHLKNIWLFILNK